MEPGPSPLSAAEQDPLKKKARLQACEALKNIGYDTDKDDTLKKHLPRLASVLASHQAAHVREEEKSCERREQGCEEEELEEEKGCEEEELEEESSDDGRKWQPRAPQVPPPSWGRSGSRAAAHHLGHGAPGAGHGEAAPPVPKAKTRSGTEPLAQVTFKTLWRRRAAEQPRPSTSRLPKSDPKSPGMHMPWAQAIDIVRPSKRPAPREPGPVRKTRSQSPRRSRNRGALE